MPTSYNGWPASRDPAAIGINRKWAPLGVPFPGGVKGGDVETVLTYVVEQLHARVEPIDLPGLKDEWGWHYKPSANSPNLLSCHSSGTAFDYNATRHPNRKRGTFTAAQVKTIHTILDEVGGVVRWLGDARTPDEMHFEIKGTPAQVADVARLLRSKPAPPEDDMAEAKELLAFLAAKEAYQSILGRPGEVTGDDAGLIGWTERFKNEPVDVVLKAMAATAEGKAK